MKKLIIMLVLLLLAVSQGAYAQKTITGKVINAEDGLGMPGVSVVVKGTTVGMATTGNGNFVLNVPNDATLVVSFMGFKTVEIPVENQTRFDIMLYQDANVLGNVTVTARRIPPPEAVMTPLGIRDKKTLTISIQSISGAELMSASDPNFMNAMNGKVAGVDVKTDGNTTVMATFRGIKSWTFGAQSPLFVIDGVPIGRASSGGGDPGTFGGMYVDITNFINSVDPNDIEDITIIRGQTGVQRYGSDAANGVVLITMKKGAGK